MSVRCNVIQRGFELQASSSSLFSSGHGKRDTDCMRRDHEKFDVDEEVYNDDSALDRRL